MERDRRYRGCLDHHTSAFSGPCRSHDSVSQSLFLRIAEEVRASIEALRFPKCSSPELRITTSVGFAVGQISLEELGTESSIGGAGRLVATADECLYEAKAGGRNCAVGREIADPS